MLKRGNLFFILSHLSFRVHFYHKDLIINLLTRKVSDFYSIISQEDFK